jgi:regulator of protease activity HflC (stomatin/prohibitin superfamily)
MRGSLREQVLDIPSQQCYTRDSAPIMADAVVYLRILDLKTACYEVEDVFHAIKQICLTQLREEIGKLTLDDTFSSREHLGKTLLSDLNLVTQTWGVQITRIELQELQPSRTIKDAMELQLAAERRKRAAILQSEGERTTLTNEAEGRASALVADATAKREASILAAQGEAERLSLQASGMKTAIQTIAQALAEARGKDKDKTMEGAIQLLMFDRYMETQARFAGGNNSKVLMFPTKDSIPLAHESLRGLFPLD